MKDNKTFRDALITGFAVFIILTAAALPKQISCLFVRLKRTFVLTRVRSFGTCTYAIHITSFHVIHVRLLNAH